ncbi:hypothetical protein F4678DRAFT_335366 [Xylaria arbuscula]|nr:hypothetical protein F4678DRAFT_335366 [Xylaria arbuscula]
MSDHEASVKEYDENERPTIFFRTRAAEGRFNELITHAKSGSETLSISVEAAIDASDKFKLWAGNIGARHFPTSAASLEARLVSANRILEQVEDLRDDLILALDDLLEIASGGRVNREITFESGSSLDNQASLPLNHQLEVGSGLTSERKESQDILDVISECTRGLLKISVLIRKATPRDRFARALQVDNPFIDQFDINYVAERYPKLRKPGFEWLCVRLGRAITKRRQFLRYSREHGRRIAGSNEKDTEINKSGAQTKASNEVQTFHISSNSQAHSSAGTKLSGSVAAHTHASTKASTLDATTLHKLREDETNEEDSRSLVSAGSSLQFENEDSRLHLPSLGELKKGDSIFECPFCLNLQTFTRESAWRRHAYRDLKAYVCSLNEGTCDSELFGDSRTWFDHELQCHRKQWVCMLCSSGPFRTAASFKSHLQSQHSDVLANEIQIEIFMNASQRAVDVIPAEECPFCDEWAVSLKDDMSVPPSTSYSELLITVQPVQFRRHVASHMEQLALFALPRNTDGDDIEQGTNQVASRSRSTDDEQKNLPRTSHTDTSEEWIPDPPLHIAAATGNLAAVRSLLEEGADVYSRGETWGATTDAALFYQGSTRDVIMSLLRNRIKELESQDMPPMTHNYHLTDFPYAPHIAESDVGWGPLLGESVFSEQQSIEKPKPKPVSLEEVEDIRVPNTHRGEVDQPQILIPIDIPSPAVQSAVYTNDLTSDEDAQFRVTPRALPQVQSDDIDFDFEYTKPSDLARYDLDHDTPRREPRRRIVSPPPSPSQFRYPERTSRGSFDPLQAVPHYGYSLERPVIMDQRYNHPRHRPRVLGMTAEDADNEIEINMKRARAIASANEKIYQRDRVGSDSAPTMSLKPDYPRYKRYTATNESETQDSVIRNEEKSGEGILKAPTVAFPEPRDQIGKGSPSIPPGATWTKISRKRVNPEALKMGGEQFEVRDDFVVVLRVLSHEEIEEYSTVTQQIREKRQEEARR